MNILDTLRARMQHNLDMLSPGHTGWSRIFPQTRRVMNQQMGQWCYLAEELLTAADLVTLKHLLNLDECQWHAYKWTFVHTAAAY